MWYLFLQIYGWVFLAFIFGWLSHWAFLGYGNNKDDKTPHPTDKKKAPSTLKAEPLAAIKATVEDHWKPSPLDKKPDTADELQKISDISAVIEETLNQLGVYQFKQIAQWSEENIAWVEKYLALPDRIRREDWVSQAQLLSRNKSQ